MGMLSREEIAEREKVLGQDFPPVKTGTCPWCKKKFPMVRYGGVNCFGVRTQIYYVEVGEHECVFIVIPKKDKEEEWVVEQVKKGKKSRSQKIAQIGLFK